MGKSFLAIYLDGMYFFRNSLGIVKIIKNDVSIFFCKDKFFIKEYNEELNTEVTIVIYKHSVKKYSFPYADEKDEDFPFFTGFKCDDFVQNIGKLGKHAAIEMRIDNKNRNRIKLIDPSSGKQKSVDTIITNGDDVEELDEYLNGDYTSDIRVDIKEFSSFFTDLKNSKCTSAIIRAYPTYMKINGKVERKKEGKKIFGNKEPNYVIEGEKSLYPIKYKLHEKAILMLGKINSVHLGGIKLKIFFLENKLVIKSKLNSNGYFILGFRTDEEN